MLDPEQIVPEEQIEFQQGVLAAANEFNEVLGRPHAENY